jgi:hypothetical protein
MAGTNARTYAASGTARALASARHHARRHHEVGVKRNPSSPRVSLKLPSAKAQDDGAGIRLEAPARTSEMGKSRSCRPTLFAPAAVVRSFPASSGISATRTIAPTTRVRSTGAVTSARLIAHGRGDVDASRAGGEPKPPRASLITPLGAGPKGRLTSEPAATRDAPLGSPLPSHLDAAGLPLLHARSGNALDGLGISLERLWRPRPTALRKAAARAALQSFARPRRPPSSPSGRRPGLLRTSAA